MFITGVSSRLLLHFRNFRSSQCSRWVSTMRFFIGFASACLFWLVSRCRKILWWMFISLSSETWSIPTEAYLRWVLWKSFGYLKLLRNEIQIHIVWGLKEPTGMHITKSQLPIHKDFFNSKIHRSLFRRIAQILLSWKLFSQIPRSYSWFSTSVFVHHFRFIKTNPCFKDETAKFQNETVIILVSCTFLVSPQWNLDIGILLRTYFEFLISNIPNTVICWVYFYGSATLKDWPPGSITPDI